jgi:uncharacterized protein YyaL (SSP411 family)
MKDLTGSRSGVGWLPWSRAAFARAGDEEKVILLSVTAAWSQACRQMDEQTYGDPSLAHQINTRCIPVRVDADRRPDVAERYDLGGLPTTAFLNADGEILGGGTFVSAQRLADALARVCQLRTGEKVQSSEERFLRAASSELGVDDGDLTEMVFSHFDLKHGGFCASPKFPLVAPVRLALDLFRETPSDEMAAYVSRTLDAIGWGPLYDETEGGFFRCAAREDWREPQREKLLATNAALFDLFLEAGVAMRNERWLKRARDVLDYIRANLSCGPGEGWRASEASDRSRLSDSNALMAAAMLRGSAVLDDASLAAEGLRSLESVLLSGYRPGHGVAHIAGGVRGLLTDQVAMLHAMLAAWDVSGDVAYRMMAQELAHFTVRTMWDAEEGGFFDHDRSDPVDDLALCQRPLKPFALNCEAAEGLGRLSMATDDAEPRAYAERTLDAMKGRAAGQGPLAAHYLLARRLLR